MHHNRTFLKGSRIQSLNCLVADTVQTRRNLFTLPWLSCVNSSCLTPSEIQSVVLSCCFLGGCGVSTKTDQHLLQLSPYSLPLPSEDSLFWDREWPADQPGFWGLSVRHGGREWEHPFHPVSSTWPGLPPVGLLRTAACPNCWSEEQEMSKPQSKRNRQKNFRKLYGRNAHYSGACDGTDQKRSKHPSKPRSRLSELGFNKLAPPI